jgi:hypothetical protein
MYALVSSCNDHQGAQQQESHLAHGNTDPEAHANEDTGPWFPLGRSLPCSSWYRAAPAAYIQECGSSLGRHVTMRLAQ